MKIIDNNLILFDRIEIIKQIISQIGEENIYLSFSGGKDSTVLHYLIDEALPNNKIARVFINTGIEYLDVVKFIKELAKTDERIQIINSSVNIIQMLNEQGYPFKSKQHSHVHNIYRNSGMSKSVINYLEKDSLFKCPSILKYQFKNDFKLKISDKCCEHLKKNIIKKWEKDNNKFVVLTGMRKAEGGQRTKLNCVVYDKDKNIKKFHPLAVVSDDWEQWYIETRNIQLCKLYYPPFNFNRTGCKGCPFSLNLQEQLEIMERLLPNEYKQCCSIWKPVYTEYRRLNYRLRNSKQINLFEREDKE